MGCDRSIAFLTRIFTQTSADPLEWHTDGLAPGSYDWKCWMDDCHYGNAGRATLGSDVAIDSDPLDSATMVAAGTPVDLVFSGAQDDVLADHPLHDRRATSPRRCPTQPRIRT